MQARELHLLRLALYRNPLVELEWVSLYGVNANFHTRFSAIGCRISRGTLVKDKEGFC